MSSQTIDEKFMQIAIDLAKKGTGKVSPNPLVGCVIVKNNKIISNGYHQYFGGPHAEILALRNLPKNLSKNSLSKITLYINLEPCCHYNKKTPPCVPEIIKSGIKKLVIAMKDPNPEVNGKGINQLKKSGIECKVGILQKEAEELNKFYIKWVTKKIPYVILKWAMSIDGKIATKTGDSKWISSQESRKYVYKLRSQVDAVLVGIKTVLKDNPYLTAHGEGRNPARIIIDPYLKIPENANVLSNEAKTIIICSKQSKERVKKILKIKPNINIEFLYFKSNKEQKIEFKEILEILARKNISSILVEGGGTTNAIALESDCVDEVLVFISPKIIGGENAITPVEGNGIEKISSAPLFKYKKFIPIGNDYLLILTRN
ncbi:MAG: bifunctional diaminohydroxyphosphoribosylaminopyrimidine deaminase/5-amino-6-(5-phosphoribosylamino)uracil reductase RibD [Endomicrobiia bacterium]